MLYNNILQKYSISRWKALISMGKQTCFVWQKLPFYMAKAMLLHYKRGHFA